jgi:hypothetical protein
LLNEGIAEAMLALTTRIVRRSNIYLRPGIVTRHPTGNPAYAAGLVTAYMFGAGLLLAITQTIAWCMRWPLPRQRARYSIRHAAALILAFCQFQCSIAPSAIPPPESERKRPARYGLALVPDRTFYGTRLATTEAFTVDSTT